MTRAFFLFGIAVGALMFTSVRVAAARRVPRRRDSHAGGCANRRARSRWSTYTAADFS